MVDFKVTVELTDPDADVRPGMTAAVEIVVSQIGEALLVPNRAVQFTQGHSMVYVLGNKGNLELIEIELGASSDKFSQVINGNLKPGDRIVLNPSEM